MIANAVEDGVCSIRAVYGSKSHGHNTIGWGKEERHLNFVQLVFIALRNSFKVFCAFQSKSEKKICMGIWQRGGCRSQ